MKRELTIVLLSLSIMIIFSGCMSQEETIEPVNVEVTDYHVYTENKTGGNWIKACNGFCPDSVDRYAYHARYRIIGFLDNIDGISQEIIVSVDFHDMNNKYLHSETTEVTLLVGALTQFEITYMSKGAEGKLVPYWDNVDHVLFTFERA